MKWFWLGFWAFLTALVVSAAIMRPDTVDATLAFTGRFVTVAAWTLFGMVVAALVIGGGIAAWTAVQRNRVASLRQKDGHYPLQRVKVAGGRVVIVDPNALVGSVLTIDRKTGAVSEHEPAAGWQIQATIRGMVERTRTAQAMFQGDDSRSSKWGSEHRGDRITASAAKLIDGPRRPVEIPPAPSVLPALPAPAVRVVPVADTLNACTQRKLPMGREDNGSLVHWDLLAAPHLRVHGRSQGAGKTNLIRALAASALRVGHHVLVLDRRRFKDWSEFAGKAELVDVRDPGRAVAVVQRLAQIYQERDALLGQAGAPNIAQLDNAPRRILVVMAEFGALCVQADADGVYGALLQPLKLVMREAGATGVHMIFEDQAPEKWPRAIVANAEPVTGYLPQNYGGAGGYYEAHKLAPYTFHFGGAVFKSLDVRGVLPAFLATVQTKEPVLEIDESRSVDRSVGAFGRPFGAFGPEVDPSPPNDRTTERPNAVEGAVGDDGPTDLQAMVWAWRDANPAGSQADLRRYFDDIGVEIARGYAHELWHRYSRERGLL